jgi:hypothetical protein
MIFGRRLARCGRTHEGARCDNEEPIGPFLTDYGKLPPPERNILRLVFGNPRSRAAHEDWETTARFVVGAFRADAARAGAFAEVGQRVAELCAMSSEFETLWRDNDVRVHGEDDAPDRLINYAVRTSQRHRDLRKSRGQLRALKVRN